VFPSREIQVAKFIQLKDYLLLFDEDREKLLLKNLKDQILHNSIKLLPDLNPTIEALQKQ
jgi:hypothetical protein